MREVELKSVVADLASSRKAIEQAGGRLTFHGRLVDKRYGDAAGSLIGRDQVLRLRVYESSGSREASLDWKGPTSFDEGYKIREEISTGISDPEALEGILAGLGFLVVLEIERTISQYELGAATVRFEEYPRMDTLVEVEGSPEDIEAAIQLLGLSRSGFTSDRLSAFVARFEARTGQRAALSSRELAGNYVYSREAT